MRMAIILVITGSIILLVFYFPFPIRTIASCIDGIQDDELISGNSSTIAGHELSFGARAQRDWGNLESETRLRVWWTIWSSNDSILSIDIVHIYAFKSGTIIFPRGDCWDNTATIIDTGEDTSIRGDIFHGPKWEVNSKITTVAQILVDSEAYYLLSTERIYQVL
jgi:hypothetical protein